MADSAEGIFTSEQKTYVSNVPENLLRAYLLHERRAKDNMTEDRDKALKKVYALEDRVQALENINADLNYRLNGGFKNDQ